MGCGCRDRKEIIREARETGMPFSEFTGRMAKATRKGDFTLFLSAVVAVFVIANFFRR